MKDRLKFIIILAVFFVAHFFPLERFHFYSPLYESFALLQEYARAHILLCLIPAFFIAGAISVFLSQAAVLKYLSSRAHKLVSYGVASVSGSVLAVCSCTVLPIFSGIYKRGAGLGPAIAFLYSGPAINVLAIILTARVLGMELGVARGVGAILFSVVIGFIMHLIYIKEERARAEVGKLVVPSSQTISRPIWQEIFLLAGMILILVFVNLGKYPEKDSLLYFLFLYKGVIVFFSVMLVIFALWKWFVKGEIILWGKATYGFALQILPLLFIGVLIAGFLLGRPGHDGLIPSRWVETLVGGNSWHANLFASVIGALMYFATLTEIPILQTLIGAGMGKGPALSLLLAGPALSLPNMLVIRSVIGTKKTLTYVSLVVIMATLSGMFFGTFF
ncbi:MAG: permease [Pseudomonadota bacterium]